MTRRFPAPSGAFTAIAGRSVLCEWPGRTRPWDTDLMAWVDAIREAAGEHLGGAVQIHLSAESFVIATPERAPSDAGVVSFRDALVGLLGGYCDAWLVTRRGQITLDARLVSAMPLERSGFDLFGVRLAAI